MILPAYKTLGIRDEKKQKAEINLFVNIFELAFQFRKIFLSFILIKGKQKIKYSATFINTKSKKVTKQKKYKFRCGIAPSLIDGVSSVDDHDHRPEITLFSLSSYNIITYTTNATFKSLVSFISDLKNSQNRILCEEYVKQVVNEITWTMVGTYL